MRFEHSTYWIVGCIVLALLVVGIVLVSHTGNLAQPTAAPTPTRESVPAGAVAPDEGAASVPVNVAVPTVQAPAAPTSDSSYRSFAIKVASGKYAPSTVIVKQGDTVDLEITAVDANYGFTQPDYGLNASIKEGKTQKIQFQALQTGKFMFYCGACGGPAKGPVGYVIVTNQ